MPKFFADFNDSREEENGRVIISGDDALHIKNALRGKPGQILTVCDKQGNDMSCKIDEINDRQVILTVINSIPADTEPEIRITLFQGLPKSDKMELIIQKTVELGVHEIVPVITEHVIVKVNKNKDQKIDRYNRISVAAAKQSMRGVVPHVSDFMSLPKAVEYSKALDLVFVAYENENKSGLKDILKQQSFKTVGVFIGPEGGFSAKEIHMFNESGIPQVTLGKRILRTETAGLVTIAIMNYEMGIL